MSKAVISRNLQNYGFFFSVVPIQNYALFCLKSSLEG